MFESIALKFTEVGRVSLPTQGVTIFVGPNNAGKSLVLRELEADVTSHPSVETKILDGYEIIWPDEQRIAADMVNLKKRRPDNISPDHVYVGRFRLDGRLEGGAIPQQALIEKAKGHSDKRWVVSQYLRYFMIRLDGRSRFDLTNDQNKGDLLAP